MKVEPVQCPHCGVEVDEAFVTLTPTANDENGLNPVFTRLDQADIAYAGFPLELPTYGIGDPRGAGCSVALMYCPRKECRKAIVAVFDTRRDFSNGLPGFRTDRWFALPRLSGARRVDPLVSEPYRRDLEEAAAILPISPRMSAVLARRLVADVLKTEGKYGRNKNALVEFVEDESNPLLLRQMADRLREAGNFGAHTQKDALTGEIIDVDRGDAEFVLDVAETLLNHFIVAPAHIREQIDKLDDKISRAGRMPLLGNSASEDDSR